MGHVSDCGYKNNCSPFPNLHPKLGTLLFFVIVYLIQLLSATQLLVRCSKRGFVTHTNLMGITVYSTVVYSAFCIQPHHAKYKYSVHEIHTQLT